MPQYQRRQDDHARPFRGRDKPGQGFAIPDYEHFGMEGRGRRAF